MLHQINPVFSASQVQQAINGVVGSWWLWHVGGDCETEFVDLLSVVGSVAAALAFSKNIALLRCSPCKDL